MGDRHTLVHRLADWAQRTPDTAAIQDKDGDRWRSYTWAEYWDAAREVAKGLIALDLEVGECVAIVGGSRTDWVIAQFGIMAARGIPAPIYTNNTTEQTAYIVQHSRSKIAIADNSEQLAKYVAGNQQGLMQADKLILMDEPGGHDDGDAMSLAALRALGREQDDAELDARIAGLTTDETALLIYTSGTTGVPKAVELSHGNMVFLVESLLDCFPLFRGEVPFSVVSYLPLCHVAEQIVTNFTLLTIAGKVYFCGDMTQIKDYLTDVRPTAFLGVPRVWEKFQAVLENKLGEATGLKAWLAAWARKTELACFKRELETGAPYRPLGRRIAQKLVIGKVKQALGLDRLQLAATGAAPVSVGTLEFFASLGIVIYELYGQSETTGLCTANRFGNPRFGKVGNAMPGVEIKIAADGEILVKSPGNTKGYLHMPEETAELFDSDGWLQTGDCGELDADGFLKITGRKKEILVTAGGKNVAPAEMEALINQIPGVGPLVVVGDRQPYLTALVTLDPEALDVLCRDAGVAVRPLAEVAADPAVHDYLMGRIEQGCNAKVARYQSIKKIRVLPVEFTVDGGEMTPTMKTKRKVVVEKYASEIEALYV